MPRADSAGRMQLRMQLEELASRIIYVAAASIKAAHIRVSHSKTATGSPMIKGVLRCCVELVHGLQLCVGEPNANEALLLEHVTCTPLPAIISTADGGMLCCQFHEDDACGNVECPSRR